MNNFEERKAFIEELEKRVGVIRFKSAYGAKHQNPISVVPCKNRQGEFLGIIERPTDEQRKSGMVLLTPRNSVSIDVTKSFDLSNKHDKAYWDFAKWDPAIGFNFEESQSPGVAYYVYIEEEVANDYVDKEEAILEVKMLIANDTLENLRNRVKILGFDMDTDSEKGIKRVLYELATKTPAKIKELYAAKLAVHLLFYKALDQHLIYKNNDGMFQFMNELIGSTKEDSIAFLSKKINDETLSLIKARMDDVDNPKEGQTVIKLSKPELVKYITDNSDNKVTEELSRNDLMKVAGSLNKK